ncbi:RDD family protein [Ferrimonas balearica]|uniref:RDD family protein n=1 Tax=Ferrimonas balearica TaxID=44012 RepID=UPI0031BAD468
MTTAQDPKDIITPDAFQIHPVLLNRPLASPWRRGIAMLIDLMVVAMVTESDGVLFVILVLATWRLRRRQWKAGTWALYLLYFLLAASLVPPLVSWVKGLGQEPVTEVVSGESHKDLSTAEALMVSGAAMSLVQIELCDDAACVRQHLVPLEKLVPVMSEAERQTWSEEILSQIPAEQREQLGVELRAALKLTAKAAPDLSEPVGSGDEAVPAEPDPVAELEAALAKEKARRTKLSKQVQALEEVGTSPLAWLQGAAKDLGLGFGLAAFYFTVFVAWFDGQTVGKKLTRCRVRQLDGTPISLWDAFGRYGGYSAGIATGLLGFIQVFWDPNRQAIHDKISATVVEDVRPQARLSARKTVKVRTTAQTA